MLEYERRPMLPWQFRLSVRRVLFTVAGLVLLLGWYVGSYIGLAFAYGAGWNTSQMDHMMPVVYAPLRLYVYGEYPGASSID